MAKLQSRSAGDSDVRIVSDADLAWRPRSRREPSKGETERDVARRALRASLDALVVVGEPTGARRTRRLPVIFVRSAADLDAAWFLACRTVGVLRGAHGLPCDVDEVARLLRAMP